MRALSTILFLLTLSSAPLWAGAGSAQDLSAGFDAANKLYAEGKFPEAAATYENLLKSGQASAALYFNLGNAYFKAGQMGRAIAAYQSAELLRPRDPDLRANLQFAQNRVQGPTVVPGAWQRWLTKVTLNEWTVIAAAALWLWLLSLALLQWRPSLKGSLRAYSISVGIATMLLCVCLAAAWLNRTAPEAVVVAPEVAVRQAPLEEADPVPAFIVHDGAELRVLDRKNEWLQVSTDPRRVGWLKREHVLLPPRS